MNRKLHNTFLAMTASTAMLSLALALGGPAVPPAAPPLAQAPQGPSDDVAADALGTAIALEVRFALAEAGLPVDEPGQAAAAVRAAAAAITGSADASGDAPRRPRQSVAVPYFSFAPRG